MSEGPFSISLSYPLDEGGLRYFLQIDHTGRAELVLESNVETPQIESIGIFQDNIGYDRALQLKNMFSTLRKMAVPAGDASVPTEIMVHVSLEEYGVTESRIIDPSTSPPAMCKAAEHLKAVGNDLLSHPLSTVSLKTGIDQDWIVCDDPIKVSIELTAQGKDRVMIVDPVKAVGNNSGGFIIWGVRSDLPPADLWPEHSKHHALIPAYLTKAKIPNEPDANGLLTLKPAQQAFYEFTIPIDWEPGEYSVKFIFETYPDVGKGIKGSIISLPVKLKVRQP